MAGRTRTTVSATVYDDFQPKCERKEEQGANVILIHLPGYAKEQINVTYVQSSHTIKVQGERPVDKNRRSRFNQAFPVPENCIIEKIQGTFRNGVLTITLPKQTIAPLTPTDANANANATKETTTTTTPPPPKAISSPQKPIKDQKETPSKQQQPIKEQKETTAPSTSNSGFEKLLPPQTPQKPITTEPKTPAKAAAAPSPPTTLPERQANGKKADTALQPSKQAQEKTESTLEKKSESKDGGLKNVVAETDTPKIAEKERKEGKAGAGLVEDVKKAKEGGGFMEKAKELKGMDTIMKTVKRLATDDQEDRQLLINIGVSVLVIVALGAYITYSYRSSGKAKD